MNDLSPPNPPIRCRVLPHARLDGPANMAWDEAILGAVADEPSAAVLRTYTWSSPTLSLGYFQGIAEAEADPRWSGAAIVRRPTGGGAIWHDGDLTYAVALPAGHPLARRTVDLYAVVHGAILAALVDLGFAAIRRGGEPDPGRQRPLLCFLDRDPEDLILGGSKVVGSAQRRRRGAVLQHGSILLKSSDRTPELPGLESAGSAGLDAWIAGIRARIPEALRLSTVEGGATPEEDAEARRLALHVYGNPVWTRRR